MFASNQQVIAGFTESGLLAQFIPKYLSNPLVHRFLLPSSEPNHSQAAYNARQCGYPDTK